MATRKAFTRDEIVLCIYAARYDIAEIGGIETIYALQSRSRSSISMKIQNIVAMCDDAGISRNPMQRSLTGRPAGETGRRTNWAELSEYAGIDRPSHLLECQAIIAKAFSWPGEFTDGSTFYEGAKRRVTVNAYERDPTARQRCIEHYGCSCIICRFDFLESFGPVAEGLTTCSPRTLVTPLWRCHASLGAPRHVGRRTNNARAMARQVFDVV